MGDGVSFQLHLLHPLHGGHMGPPSDGTKYLCIDCNLPGDTLLVVNGGWDDMYI